MHVPVKIITGVWENTNATSPISFQHVVNPTISWKDAVLDDLRNAIRQGWRRIFIVTKEITYEQQTFG